MAEKTDSKVDPTGKAETEELNMNDKSTNKKFYKRKEIPSVQYLLAHGDPETAHLPKTWCEIIGYPLALATVFAISLLIFHHAPNHLLPPRQKYTLPGIQRLPIFDRRRSNHSPGPLHRHPAAKIAELKKEANREEKKLEL